MITIKDKRIKEIIGNIAEDFRFSAEMAPIPLMFYQIESLGNIEDDQVPKLVEYLETGLEELVKDIEWREEFLSNNQEIGEIKMLETLKTIEEEYKTLLAFLKS